MLTSTFAVTILVSTHPGLGTAIVEELEPNLDIFYLGEIDMIQPEKMRSI
jgi:hypothetical protein